MKWPETLPIGSKAHCYHADGNLYSARAKMAINALVEATPEAYHEKGRFTPPDAPDRWAPGLSMKAWAYPVLLQMVGFISATRTISGVTT